MGKITGAEIVAQAKKYIGEGSARFADAYGQPRQYDWCCVFVWYIYNSLHANDLFYGGKKTAWVPNVYDFDRAHLKRVSMTEALPGDVVLFDINQNGTPDHIGFVTGRKSASQIYTIEGNTTGRTSSCVAEKVRNAAVILGIFRPAYADTNAGIITVNRIFTVVNKNGANMRRGAGMNYATTGHVPCYTDLRMTKMFRDKKNNVWYWTRYGDKSGWIPLKYGKRIYLHIKK